MTLIKNMWIHTLSVCGLKHTANKILLHKPKPTSFHSCRASTVWFWSGSALLFDSDPLLLQALVDTGAECVSACVCVRIWPSPTNLAWRTAQRQLVQRGSMFDPQHRVYSWVASSAPYSEDMRSIQNTRWEGAPPWSPGSSYAYTTRLGVALRCTLLWIFSGSVTLSAPLAPWRPKRFA